MAQNIRPNKYNDFTKRDLLAALFPPGLVRWTIYKKKINAFQNSL